MIDALSNYLWLGVLVVWFVLGVNEIVERIKMESVNELKAASDALIARCQTHLAEIASLKAEIAAMSAAIQPVTDALKAADPA